MSRKKKKSRKSDIPLKDKLAIAAAILGLLRELIGFLNQQR